MTLPQRIAHILNHGMAALHPCVYGELNARGAIGEIAADLEREIALLCPDRDAKEIVAAFTARLPEVRRLVETDVTAAYEGDPAATSRMEVVMSYPGLYAVTVHRLAHELYRLKVPIIPRVMSELAHSKTGIDIHPGATIGERFFIDHGTGVVIGETCVIGRNVRLYQGVTLGGLSFAKDASGALVKGLKRHPNIEDDVVIYANATILGGETTIGAGSEIGGNVWLHASVPPNSRVYNNQPAPVIKTRPS
ncbi:MAG: serine acetyltransferase [Kiritimatiellae bacterium]|nr:serine acetyltransferase [Kiritimatiellia bacterium]